MKNGKIELLRFLTAVSIVFTHGRYFTSHYICIGGWHGVEFFLILTGFLSARTILHKSDRSFSLPYNCFHFLKKKLAVFYPEFVISWFIGFLVCVYADGLSVKQIIHSFINSMSELLLLKMALPNRYGVNGATWYLSAMLIGLLILFPLVYYKSGEIAKIVLPLFIIGLMTYLRYHGDIGGNMEWVVVCYKGTLRTILGLSIGIVSYFVSVELKKLNFTRTGIFFIRCLETAIYLTFFVSMFKVEHSVNWYLIELMLSAAIIFSLSFEPAVPAIWQNKVCFLLGKLSLPLYLSHYYYCKKINLLIPGLSSDVQKYCCLWIMTGVTTIIVYAAGQLYRKKKHLFQGILIDS